MTEQRLTDLSIREEIPRIAGKYEKQEETRKDLPLEK